jgi:quercetin dioxygenase-like cupin family protein
MKGRFIFSAEIERMQLDWGQMGYISNPPTTRARHIVEIEVILAPGGGHNFHKHPQQEEVIHVVEGQIEQWLEDKKQILQPGDSIFIAPDVVHASFNTGSQNAKLMVVLAPCIGEVGYELVDVSGEAPWNKLRD